MIFAFINRRGGARTPLVGGALALATWLVRVPASAAEAPREPAATSAITSARRIAHFVDYVGADYAKATGGGVVDEKELAEQAQVIEEAERAADGLGDTRDTTMSALQDIAAAIKLRASAADVAAKARAIHATLAAKFPLASPPATPPSRARGAELFSQLCAPCHGPNGNGDGPRAALLGTSPLPTNFHDPRVAAGMSPDRAFNTSRFGVPGTAMAPIDYLSDADRWAVAFYVAGLSHQPEPSGAPSGTPGGAPMGTPSGSAAAEPAPAARLFTLAELATHSDDELRDDLRGAGFSGRGLDAALDEARARAPYDLRSAVSGLAHAAIVVGRVRALYAAGKIDEARSALLASYLDDVEPQEAGLRVHDSGAAGRIEASFREVRGIIERRAPFDQLSRPIGVLRDELATASARAIAEDATKREGGGAFVATLLASAGIALREGVEAALLIGALIAVLVRAGMGDRKRWVYAGCGLALLAGLATFVAAQRLIRLSGLGRETVEGVSALLASAVLFYVSYWLFAKNESARWVAFLRQQVATRRAAYALFGISFVAVYREAFETVLFYEALLAEPGIQAGAAVLGVALGLGLLALLVLLYGRAGRLSPPKAFFTFSTVLLYTLAVVFAGQGIAALQNADKLPLHPASLPRLPVLGLYPTVETYVAQAVLVVAAVAAAVVLKKRAEPS